MNSSGDAAEQVVRLSLEGAEVAAKITGEVAKNIAILLISALKQEQKTKGKARLTNMIKSGKELKVFTLENKDLKKFKEQAKKYGILYTVLRDRKNKDGHAIVDIIARAEDASKIERIQTRFNLTTVDVGSVVKQSEKVIESKKKKAEQKENENAEKDEFFDEVFSDDDTAAQKSKKDPAENAKKEKTDNPFSERTESPLSEQSSTDTTQLSDKGAADKSKKDSVKSKLNNFKKAVDKQKSDKSKILDVAKGEHQTPKLKNSKER